MTSKNDITGQKQQTKPASDTYRDNYDRIFGSKPKNLVKTLGCPTLDSGTACLCTGTCEKAKNDLPTGR